MPQPQTIPYAHNSFSGGEWDPQLSSSVDLAKYRTSCKVMRNFFAHVNGKVSNRQGLQQICQTATSTTVQSSIQNTRIVPFIFNTAQSYVLEFSNYVMRVIKNGQLLQSTQSDINTQLLLHLNNSVLDSSTNAFTATNNNVTFSNGSPGAALLTDGDFEMWNSPSQLTNWTTSGSGALSQTTNPIYSGTYSAGITYAGSTNISQSYAGYAALKGSVITLGAWVWSSTAGCANISISDGTQNPQSSFHPGDSQWHYLSVSMTVSNSASQLVFYMQVSYLGTAYFDAATANATYSQPVFSGTYYGIFNGTSADITLAQHSAFNIGTNLTMEGWINISDNTGYYGIVESHQDNNNYYILNYGASSANVLQFSVVSGGVSVGNFKCTYTLTNNTWYHIEFVKSGTGTPYMFINGVLQTVTVSTAWGSLPTLTSGLSFGTVLGGFSGYAFSMSEFRISNSARNTSSFTPPSSPYTNMIYAPYSIATPYSSSVVMKLGYTQSADTVFLAHPSVAPQMVQRISDTNWTITAYPFQFGPWLLDNTTSSQTITASGAGQVIPVGNSVTLTASGCAPFVSGHVGALWELFHYVPNQTVNNAASLPTASISCGGTWRLITNGTWTGDVWVEKSLDGGNTWLQLNYYNALSNFNVNTYGTEDMSNNAPPFLVRANGTVSSGTIEVTLTSDPYIQPGMVQITTVQSSTVVVGVVTQPIGLNNTATSDWAEGAWSTYRGWPSTCEFSPDDRLCWANTPYQPITSFITQTSNYYNFNVSNPLSDSDALNINLPSRQLNAINSFIPLRAILALTSGGEWSIESINGVTAPLTPNTVYQRVHGYEGSTQVRPITIGIRAIFVQALGKVIRDVGYELIFDSFTGANISVFSNHLFYFDNIIDMTYCQNPDSLVWLVMASGDLVSLTYLREQQVVTFARHDSYGKFMSTCSIADTVNNYNAPYFVVNRANGQFIEFMPKRMLTNNIQDQFFVDCGGVYDALGQTFQNPNLDTFSLGPNFAPDYWTLSGSGTVSQSMAIVENKLASTCLQGASPILYQRMDQAYGSTYWQGRQVTFKAYVNCSSVNCASVAIYDGVTTAQSAYHPGDGAWHLLSVTTTISATASQTSAECKVVSGLAYFNNSNFNSGVSQITGANWLNGQTVSILADGNVLPQVTVQNGVINLGGGINYNKIAYGLPYVSQLQPATPHIDNPAGTMQGRTINIGKAVIGVWNTASGKTGSSFSNMQPIVALQGQQLITAPVNVVVGGGYLTDNSICIEQSDPLPMTVCDIITELQIGGIPAIQGQ